MNIADAQIIKKIKSKKTDVEVKIVHCCEERRKASPLTYRLGPSHLREPLKRASELSSWKGSRATWLDVASSIHDLHLRSWNY
jgi:hypothetical protein